MEKETLKYILTDFHEKPLPGAFTRKVELPLDVNKKMGARRIMIASDPQLPSCDDDCLYRDPQYPIEAYAL